MRVLLLCDDIAHPGQVVIDGVTPLAYLRPDTRPYPCRMSKHDYIVRNYNPAPCSLYPAP